MMSAIEFFRELICQEGENSSFVNLSVVSFGNINFSLGGNELSPDEWDDEYENTNINPNGDFNYDFLCKNNTNWNRDVLLGNDVFRKLMDDLNVYLTPVLILLGILGNIIACLVFTMTHLRRQSSSIYLASLAIVDILFLLCLSVIWLSWIRVNVFHRHIWCQCIMYLSYVTNFLSVWYVVSFTIERYIIVHYPLRKDRFCTRGRAKKVVLLLALLSSVLYSFSIVTNGSISFDTVPVCMPLTKYYRLVTIATAMDFIITLLVPSLLIIAMNVKIVVRIMRYSKQRVDYDVSESKKLNSGERKTTSSLKKSSSYDAKGLGPVIIEEKSDSHALCSIRAYRSKPVSYNIRSQSIATRLAPRSAPSRTTTTPVQHIRIAHGKTRAQYRTARMLIIVSSVFVILHSPNHIFRINAFFQSSLDERYMTDLMALKWHELFQLLYHLNFSINFYLYSACGRQFRIALKTLCSRMVHKMRAAKRYLDKVCACTVSNGNRSDFGMI